MDLFILDEEIIRLEVELSSRRSTERLPFIVEIAWALRQRDTARSQVLAEEAEGLLSLAQMPVEQAERIRARMLLVQAESEWLFSRLDTAQEMAERAARLFAGVGDMEGGCDAHLLQAWIATDQGQGRRRDAELQSAFEFARQGGDHARLDVVEATMARWHVFTSAGAARERWGARFTVDRLSAATAAAVYDFLARLAFYSGDVGGAAAYDIKAYESAVQTGQRRNAIIAATNTGEAFRFLNDHQSELEWVQRGLDKARSVGWPRSLGASLAHTAEAMRHLGRLEAAQDLLSEAFSTMASMSNARPYAIMLWYQAELSFDKHEHAEALRAFQLLAERADALGHIDLRMYSRCGQAKILSLLGRQMEALAEATDALSLAQDQGDVIFQIAALKVLSDIHVQHALPVPPGMTAPSAPLHYLQQALTLAESTKNYTVPGDLLAAIGQEYAKLLDFEPAYAFSNRAIEAQKQTHSLDATNRAIAFQIQRETEQARTQARYHQQLAESEARRADLMQQTSITLERLGEIGQEITTNLDVDAVCRTLDRHLRDLLEAETFIIYVLAAEARELTSIYAVEAGQLLTADRIPLDHPHRHAARCVRERGEFQLELEPDVYDASHVPGTLVILSALFAPLMIGERILGAMTIQSSRAHAYGEREQFIFRTLCAYGAIALDNANAYRQVEAANEALRSAQSQLEQMSLHDPLTGLRNRRFLTQHIEGDIAATLSCYHRGFAESEQIARPESDLTFFLIDIDFFKAVNDTHGHAAGDELLVQMGKRLEGVFRESDYLMRWGGEEFLGVLRHSNRATAEEVAERIRHAVAARPFELEGGVRLHKTCSVGFASYPFLSGYPQLLSWPQVLELADRALYRAKHEGRNAWCGYTATAQANPDGYAVRVLQNTEQAEQDGALRRVFYASGQAIGR